MNTMFKAVAHLVVTVHFAPNEIRALNEANLKPTTAKRHRCCQASRSRSYDKNGVSFGTQRIPPSFTILVGPQVRLAKLLRRDKYCKYQSTLYIIVHEKHKSC